MTNWETVTAAEVLLMHLADPESVPVYVRDAIERAERREDHELVVRASIEDLQRTHGWGPIEVGTVDPEEAKANWIQAIQVSEADRKKTPHWTDTGFPSRGGVRPGAGRKATSEDGNKMQLSTRLDPAALVRLHELSQRTGYTKAQLLERMIMSYEP
jgi:predicted DNA-binding protein